jgi:ornithine carbamoyltransferase
MEEWSKKPLKNISFCYLGDARFNMGNSLLIGAVKMGMDIRIGAPEALWPNAELVAQMKELAASTGATITLDIDPIKAVKDVDFLYTDVWVSMGEPMDTWGERIKQLHRYQVNQALMHATGNKDCKFMHCLPAFHNLDTEVSKEINTKFGLSELEVTDEVFESKASIVFNQAENRLHTIKALLVATLSS